MISQPDIRFEIPALLRQHKVETSKSFIAQRHILYMNIIDINGGKLECLRAILALSLMI